MLNYKIECVINNWFKYDYDTLDYDTTGVRETVADTAYCPSCDKRKSLSLMRVNFDAQNRKRYKCKACYTEIDKAKGVKK